MAQKRYDATKEHAPLERSKGADVRRHPNKGRNTKHPVTGKTA